jgi:hypothetical protein
MQDYEFRFQDRLEVTVHVQVLPFTEDSAALEHGRTLSSTHAIEVWKDGFLVASLKKGQCPSVNRGARKKANSE